MRGKSCEIGGTMIVLPMISRTNWDFGTVKILLQVTKYLIFITLHTGSLV